MWLKKKIDPHIVLSKAFERVKVNGLPCLLVTSGITNLSVDGYYARALLVFLANCHMAIKAIFAARESVVVFREFSLGAIFFMSPLLFFFKERLLFNINHNLKNKREACSVYFTVLARMGFRFLLFDGRRVFPYLSRSLSSSVYVPPFPLPGEASCQRNKSIFNSRFLRVGIAGDFRSEKGGVEALLAAIKAIQPVQDVEIVVGARSPNSIASVMPSCIMLVDTASEENFREFLEGLDFIVILATYDGYFFRHSGTLLEAVLHRVVPIVPEYPVFAEQISWPKQIGVAYADIKDLTSALELAKSNLPDFRSNFSEYYSGRSSVSFSMNSKNWR